MRQVQILNSFRHVDRFLGESKDIFVAAQRQIVLVAPLFNFENGLLEFALYV
jgi:hypothetical protein